MTSSEIISRLRAIDRMPVQDSVHSQLRQLIHAIDQAAKVEDIQIFAQMCTTEDCPHDLAQALRDLADSFEPF